eukprot:1149939-Pelagomonas_calceolata.AAC.4
MAGTHEALSLVCHLLWANATEGDEGDLGQARVQLGFWICAGLLQGHVLMICMSTACAWKLRGTPDDVPGNSGTCHDDVHVPFRMSNVCIKGAWMQLGMMSRRFKCFLVFRIIAEK